MELIKKYVSPKTKRYAKCLEKLEAAKESFIKQEQWAGKPYSSYPFWEYRRFIEGAISAITHGNRDGYELSKKLKKEWNQK